jgi:hypothetical protein
MSRFFFFSKYLHLISVSSHKVPLDMNAKSHYPYMCELVKSFDPGQTKSLSHAINGRLVFQARNFILIQFLLQFNRILIVTVWIYYVNVKF